MHRLGSSVPLSSAATALAAACYGVALLFHNQYLRAHGVVSQAMRERGGVSGLPAGLPSPEAYFTRAEAMFYLGMVIWAFAIIVALVTNRWYGWLAFLVVTCFIFAIPLSVLVRV
jgi:hypothetical protein